MGSTPKAAPAAGRASGDRDDEPARIAIVGDVHGHWNEADRRWFDASDYHLIVFVGDLASYLRDGRAVAKSIARLHKPALVMPGNHDGVGLPQLAAEVFDQQRLADWLGQGQPRRVAALERALGRQPLVGYSRHPLRVGAHSLTLIAGRPHSLGGPTLGFRRYLRERFDVGDMQASAARLEELIASTAERDIILLGHNGPSDLGAGRGDIWGCDFAPERGDFGDPDLRAAIAHARGLGKRVRAVVAGHMHHRLKGGGMRRWQLPRNEVLYLNAARVPRIIRRDGHERRHHVRLELDADSVRAEEVWVDGP